MKKILTLLLFVSLVHVSHAQYRGGGGGADKWYFGGGMGLSFGTDVTAISASPLVGYRLTEEFSVGGQATYMYVNNKVNDLTYSNYGGGPFVRYVLDDRYIAHIEYELLSYEYFTGFLTPKGDLETDRDTYGSLFIGGGYREPVGRNAAFFMIALYNVLYADDPLEPSPYASPLQIRAGIAVGF